MVPGGQTDRQTHGRTYRYDRQTDRHTAVHTDMTKTIVIFPSFANEHKSCQFWSRKEMKHVLKQSWKKYSILRSGAM